MSPTNFTNTVHPQTTHDRSLALRQVNNWPWYRSFKNVKAAQIIEIHEFAINQEVGQIVVTIPLSTNIATMCQFTESVTSIVINPAKLFARGLAKPGDYYVVYEDGYDSWSPKDTFEKGYLLLSGSPEDNVSLNATKQDWNFIRSAISSLADHNNRFSTWASEGEREAFSSFLRKTEVCLTITNTNEGSKNNV
jgi:hypothetical protein